MVAYAPDATPVASLTHNFVLNRALACVLEAGRGAPLQRLGMSTNGISTIGALDNFDHWRA